jgi:hypothetical protein
MNRSWQTFIGLLALSAASAAQADPPVRVGNIWGGLDHEPDPAIVHEGENAKGVLPSPQRQEQLDNDVERTARELLGQQTGQAHPGEVRAPSRQP